MDNHRHPILVTGMHRSGTTWVGKMLAANNQVAYISEPLNVWHRPGVLRAPIKRWYTYISKENEADYLPALRDTIRLRYHLFEEVKSLRSRKDLLRFGRDWSIFLKGRLFRQIPLLKDPFAVFSAGWFAEALGCQVVFVVRHPAAVASSLTRLDWPFDFNDLLEQPNLMRDWLEPFRKEMVALKGELGDLVALSCLLWRMVYSVAAKLKAGYPGFFFVRHEDLSQEPLTGFCNLYSALGLEFNSRAKRAIELTSSVKNPKEVSKEEVHSVLLDSRANISNWKNRLTRKETVRIRNLTEEVARKYYGDEDWM